MRGLLFKLLLPCGLLLLYSRLLLLHHRLLFLYHRPLALYHRLSLLHHWLLPLAIVVGEGDLPSIVTRDVRWKVLGLRELAVYA